MGTAPDFRRVATRVDFQDPCVLEDLDGRVLVYEPRAVIIHLGESPLAGHYRTYLLPSKLLTDDFTGATSAKPADLSLIGSSAYLGSACPASLSFSQHLAPGTRPVAEG